jgi:D-alanyl-D-alanine carboxypeptidase
VLVAVVLGAPSSAVRALKAAQLLERGFNSNGGLQWLIPSLGTVESLQPINAAPPNLRDEMCGGHRKRPATEDEDDVVAANTAPDSPYAVFLSSLHPPKTKGAALLQEGTLGEPVLVYTGIKPPAPGAAQAGWGEPKPKTASKKTKDAKATAAKDIKPAAAKDGAKDKDGAAPNAAATSPDAAPAPAPKPKPKKPAAKPTPAAASPAAAAPNATSATQLTTQAR